MPWVSRPLEERFLERVLLDDGCWLWTGGTDKDGYGKIRPRAGEIDRTHRVAYELFRGPIPPGGLVLHTCDNPPCVNPGHLYIGTHADNGRDIRERKRTRKAQQTHCIHGHEFTVANTIVRRNGCRTCRTCHNERRRRR